MRRRLVAHTLFALLGVAGAGIPGPVRSPQAIEAQRSSGSLVRLDSPLEREVFTYVVAGRRDPFLAPSPPVTAAARFHGVRLLGIISHHDPRRSIALIRVHEEEQSGADGVGSGPGSNGGESHRARIGDRIGNLRIMAIGTQQVVVALDGPAGTSRRIIELDSEARSDSR